MYSERQMQVRVGLLVIVASTIGVGLAVRFGELQQYFEKSYPLTLRLTSTSGLYPTAPVRLHGITIGRVDEIRLAADGNGVIAQLLIREPNRISATSRVVISRALLGETSVEVLPGPGRELLPAGSVITGEPAVDPLELVLRMEQRVAETLTAFQATSLEWQRVGANLNQLVETQQGSIGVVVERAAVSLHEFTRSMQQAQQLMIETRQIVADPAVQQSLKATLVALPEMVQETKATIAATRKAVEQVDLNLSHLSKVTEPIGQRGPALVAKLDGSLRNLDLLLTELSRFGKLINDGDGTLHRLASDSQLYDNLNRSSQSMAVVLRNIEPLVKDLREFSDKIARNPELLGVGGALRPSAGLRDNELLEQGTVTPASATTSQRQRN